MANIMPNLDQFYGTDNWYKHWAGSLLFTDGIKYLADQVGAYWLIDLVASYPHKTKDEPFTLWSIKSDGKGGCIVEARRDSGEEPIVSQAIEYTDFPEDFEWYVVDGVMMLKSEY